MQRDWFKIPYHAVQPSSEAQHIFCSMEGWASSCTEEEKNRENERRLSKVRRNASGSLTSGRPLAASKPINLYLTGHLFLTQRLLKRLQQNQARDYGIGMQQRAAMRFVGGLLAPLSQQSAVSRLSAGLLRSITM